MVWVCEWGGVCGIIKEVVCNCGLLCAKVINSVKGEKGNKMLLQRYRILVADDEECIRHFMSSFLKERNYEPILAKDGEEAYKLAQKELPDLILLDVSMPGANGIKVCRLIKMHPQLRLTPVVLVTSLSDLDSRIAGLSAGADDFFTKPFEQAELSARIKSLLALKHYTDEMERAETVITSLALCIEARDPYTAGHCERLAQYAVALGKRAGLIDDELRAVRLGGILHDLGKIGIPDGILLKPGPLTPQERKVVEGHSMIGAKLCSPLKSFDNIIPVIKYHHEKWNGTGYPERIGGDGIPITARVMAVVDVFDALNTKRSYKPALSTAESIRILQEETDKGFWDPTLVKHFIQVVKEDL